MPDLGWMQEYLPETDTLEKIGQDIRKFAKNLSLPDLPRPKKVSIPITVPSSALEHSVFGCDYPIFGPLVFWCEYINMSFHDTL